MATVLIVEDDPAILLGLRENLMFEGYTVLDVRRGDAAVERLAESRPDLLIVDVMLPGMNGFEFCRRVRKSGNRVPILIVSARSDDVDKVMGLDLGADDYLTKPFSVAELIARVRALLRRCGRTDDVSLPASLRFADVELDFVRYTAKRGGKPVHLTPKEFAVVRYLAANEGVAITRDALIDRVWGEDVYPSHRTVDTHVLCIRNKLESNASNPRHFLTVHGVGYKFVRDCADTGPT